MIEILTFKHTSGQFNAYYKLIVHLGEKVHVGYYAPTLFHRGGGGDRPYVVGAYMAAAMFLAQHSARAHCYVCMTHRPQCRACHW